MKKSVVSEFKDKMSYIFKYENLDFRKLYEEMLLFFSESQTDYIIRRYNELKSEGYRYKEICTLISDEISQRLFRGKRLSDRQIKRIIYKEK